MNWMRRLLSRRRLERELDAELRDHLERAIADGMRAGFSQAEAARRARLSFGGPEQIKESCRDARGTRFVEDVIQDVRYGVRMLARAPGFTAAAVLSLGLGIGANVAVFSLVNGLLLRTLPVQEPERLLQLAGDEWTNPIWEQIRDRQTLWAGAAAWAFDRVDLGTGGEVDSGQVLWSSGGLFDVLGVPALVGRTLRPSDDRPNDAAAGPVAVISYRCWQQRFGGAADIVGRGIAVNRVPFTIVGVTPPGFLGPMAGAAFDVAIPIAAVRHMDAPGPRSRLEGRATWWLDIMIRMRPDQTVDSATQALRGIQPIVRARTLPPEFSPDALRHYLTDPFQLTPAGYGSDAVRRQFQGPLLALFALVAVVLLIACTNIANLLMARAGARAGELRMRRALGASAGRVVRQLMTESLLLAGAGAMLGVAFAAWASRMLVRQFSTPRRTVVLDLSLDWRILGFAAAVAVATAIVFGLLPALRARVAQPNTTGLRAHTGRMRGAGGAAWMLCVQVALSLVLLGGAGLFIRSFVALLHVPLGFEPDPVLLVGVHTSRTDLTSIERADLVATMVRDVSHVPGVASAAASVIAPVSGMGWNGAFEVPGRTAAAERDRIAWVNAITPGWFATYGTQLQAGRDFDDHDGPGAPRVAIVNEAFARRFFQRERPLGEIVRGGGPPESPATSFQIVGIVQSAVYRNARDGAEPTVYVPMAQAAAEDMPPFSTIAIRSRGMRPAALTNMLVERLTRIRSDVSVSFLPLAEQVAASRGGERLVAIVSGFFGALALLIAGIGLYGMTAYSVSLRRSELAIRMALGARRESVVRLVMQRALVAVLAGIAAGALATWWLSRFVQGLLFDVRPGDPLTLAAAAAALLTAAALAAWLPARRAARLDPALVLKD